MLTPRFLIVSAALSLAACRSASVSPRASAQPDSLAIRRDVEYLASPALAGRLTGSAGNDSAAAYIARRYAALGLRAGVPGYLQRFTARANVRNSASLSTQNVVAILPGRDPSLSSQYVVVGAHLDHLGASTEFANDPHVTGLRLGADDNASGTVAVMELARLFAAAPTRRSLVFVNFSGEEQGLLGSQYFAENSPVPLASVDGMINFDMVGRLKNDRLLIAGVGTANEFQAVLDSANRSVGLKIATSRDGWGRSDHASFTAKDVPVLHFFTDVHEDYHRATDVSEKINAAGEARVVALAERVVRELADRTDRLTFVRIAQPMAAGGSRGTGVYFGSIPDMAGSDTPGLRLQGVTAGSPADKAGIKAGDVVVEFAGKAVKDLNDYSEALYGHKPDDEVAVVVLREGRRMTFTVKLGRRG